MKISREVAIGVTEEINGALSVACDFLAMKQSQYGRIAILEKLAREGYLKHPSYPNHGERKSWQD